MSAFPSDEELVKRAICEDRLAWEALFRRHHDLVWRMAWNLCNIHLDDPQAAEDIAQVTWLAVFRQLKSYRYEAKFSTWVYSICRGMCINELRKRHREPVTVPLIAADAVPTDPTNLDETLTLQQAVRSLPENLREAVTLVYIIGFSGTDAAIALGLSRTTLASRLTRALAQLRVTYGARPFGPKDQS